MGKKKGREEGMRKKSEGREKWTAKKGNAVETSEIKRRSKLFHGATQHQNVSLFILSAFGNKL